MKVFGRSFTAPGTLLFVWCAVCGGQDVSPPIIRTNVHQVLVPVIVTDKQGKYVTDLARDDFRVLEDGVPQTIVAFSRSPVTPPAQSSDSVDGRAAAVPYNRGLNASPQRTYLIALDTLHSDFGNFVRVRSALEKFFEQEEAGDAQYALVALGWKLHVIVDSTREPAKILQALDSKSLLKTIQESEASNIAAETERFSQLVGRWCGSCQCQSHTQDLANQLCPALKGQVQSSMFSFSERTSILNGNFLEAVSQLLNAMISMPTERTVLWISDGFNRFPGEELYAVLRANGVSDPMFKFNPHDLQPDLERILRVAVQHDIRFYTVDSRGLYTHSAVPGSGQDASSRGASLAMTHEAMSVAWFNGDAMAQLARQTGGQFFENSNDLLKGIRKAFADGREEYLLAYVPVNTTFNSQFRKITVEVRAKKLHVSAKAGYWATPGDTESK